MGKTDNRVKIHEFDVETDQRVNQKLADMGINKTEDLASGRQFDAGSVANHMLGVDPEMSPLKTEKMIRDAQFAEMAGHPANPTTDEEPAQPASGTPPAPSREEQLNADLTAAKAEADSWKQKYGERENRLGDERRKTAERLARLEGGGSVAPPAQNVSTGFTPSMQYDPRLLGGRDPDAPMTNAEGASLLQSLAQAWGAELTTREAQLLETTRQLRDYNVTPDQEVSLIERHKWLANLPRGEQMAAMRDLAPAVTPTQPSGTPPMPAKQDMVELARQRIRTATTYIEPSTQGSPVEASATGEDNSALAKKSMRLRELLDTPGASTDEKTGPEMERLTNDIMGYRR